MRKLACLQAVLLAVCVASAMAAPMAIYHMDDASGTIADATGNGNDGTFDGAATDYGLPSPFGTGLQFRGGQEVNCGNGIAIDDRSFTIEAWLRPDAARGSQELIASKPEGTSLSNLHLRLGGPGSTWPAPGGMLMGFYSGDLPSGGGHVADEQWQHVAFVFQKNATAPHDRTIYVNGTPIAHDNPSYVYQGTGGNLYIGSWNTSQFLHGQLDEFRVYDSALDLATVQSHARGGYETAQPKTLALAHHCEDPASPIADSSFWGNDGNYTGTDTQAPGRFGNALAYDGVNDTTSVAPAPVIDFANKSFTIEMWVNQDASRKSEECVASKPDEGGNDRNMHIRLYDHGQIRIDWFGNSTNAGGVYTADKLDTWHHLGFTYDYDEAAGNGTRTIYFDGQPVAQNTGVSPYLGTGGNFYIGSWGGGQRFTGSIDEPRVYTYALDAATMARHADGVYQQAAPQVPLLVMGMDDTANPIEDATGIYTGDYNGTGFSQTGRWAKALAFDGIDDRVRVDADGVLDFDQRSFTIEMWVNQDASRKTEECVASKPDEGGNYRNMHLRLYNTGQIRFDWYGSATDAYGVYTPDLLGDWHHLAFAYDYDPLAGNGVRRIFFDGAIVGENTGVAPYLGTGGDFYLGSWGGYGQQFTGLMDEARVYNYALDPSVVWDHYRLQYDNFGIPEPTTLCLLGAGLLAVARRRRKR